METTLTELENKVMEQGASRAFKEFSRTTHLEFEWFLNTAFIGVMKARKAGASENAHYVWKAITGEINRELNIEIGRKRDSKGEWHQLERLFERPGTHESLELDPAAVAEHDKIQAKQELWTWAQEVLSQIEYKCIRLWAEGFSRDDVKRMTGLSHTKAYDIRMRGIKKLKENYNVNLND